MDMNLAWLRLAAAAEGTPERVLSELLRRRGVSTVVRGLEIDKVELAVWLQEKLIPDEFHVRVCDLYKSQLATDQRAGVGKIDVEVAVGQRARGEKHSVIAAEFGVTRQAVTKALKKARRPEGG